MNNLILRAFCEVSLNTLRPSDVGVFINRSVAYLMKGGNSFAYKRELANTFQVFIFAPRLCCLLQMNSFCRFGRTKCSTLCTSLNQLFAVPIVPCHVSQVALQALTRQLAFRLCQSDQSRRFIGQAHVLPRSHWLIKTSPTIPPLTAALYGSPRCGLCVVAQYYI